MEAPVLYEKDGHVVTLTLNRPDELNAFSDKGMIDAFIAAIERLKADKDVRAVVLTGAGDAFSAGGNVKHMRDRTDMFQGGPAEIREAYLSNILRVPPLFYGLDIPTIAAVNGKCYGAAVDLVCMCDIRIGSINAEFGLPFVKIGIAPGDGAAWFLPRVVGHSVASELLLTGDPVDANRAREIGLIGRVLPKNDLLEEAKQLAHRISSRAPIAVKLTKRLIREGQHQSLNTHLEMCAAYQAIAHKTDDHREALDAFFEKRTPNFNGM